MESLRACHQGSSMAMEISPKFPTIFRATHCSTPRSSYRNLAFATLAESNDKPASQTSSSSPSSSPGIPKLEPFNRGRVSRLVKDRSLLEKAEHAISDRCSTLEGDDAYECWEALFEFEDMKEEYTGECSVAPENERQTACGPLERLESFVRQSGGVASLINNVRVLARANLMRKASGNAPKQEGTPLANEESSQPTDDEDQTHFFPEAGNLPPTNKELEWEKSAMMPESPFAQVLRAVGVPSSWFGQPSD